MVHIERCMTLTVEDKRAYIIVKNYKQNRIKIIEFRHNYHTEERARDTYQH